MHMGRSDLRVLVTSAGRRVELMQVVRLHPGAEHGAKQVLKGFGAVVHSA